LQLFRQKFVDLISSVNGVNWKLFRGTVATWTVLSFVAPTEITNFNQDLKPFFSLFSLRSPTDLFKPSLAAYLVQNQGIPSNQFLVQAQAGTEPFVGT